MGCFILRFILSLCQNIERHFLWPLFSLLQCSIAAIRMLQLINGMVLKIYMHKPHPVCQHHSLSVSWVPNQIRVDTINFNISIAIPHHHKRVQNLGVQSGQVEASKRGQLQKKTFKWLDTPTCQYNLRLVTSVW